MSDSDEVVAWKWREGWVFFPEAPKGGGSGMACFPLVPQSLLLREREARVAADDTANIASVTAARLVAENTALRARVEAAEAALREMIDLCAVGDVTETTEAMGWGDVIQRARAALAQSKDTP